MHPKGCKHKKIFTNIYQANESFWVEDEFISGSIFVSYDSVQAKDLPVNEENQENIDYYQL